MVKPGGGVRGSKTISFLVALFSGFFGLGAATVFVVVVPLAAAGVAFLAGVFAVTVVVFFSLFAFSGASMPLVHFLHHQELFLYIGQKKTMLTYLSLYLTQQI